MHVRCNCFCLAGGFISFPRSQDKWTQARVWKTVDSSRSRLVRKMVKWSCPPELVKLNFDECPLGNPG